MEEWTAGFVCYGGISHSTWGRMRDVGSPSSERLRMIASTDSSFPSWLACHLSYGLRAGNEDPPVPLPPSILSVVLQLNVLEKKTQAGATVQLGPSLSSRLHSVAWLPSMLSQCAGSTITVSDGVPNQLRSSAPHPKPHTPLALSKEDHTPESGDMGSGVRLTHHLGP